MHGSQVILASFSSINLKSTNDYITCSRVKKVDNHTIYSLAKRGGKYGCYGYNPHCGWNKLSPEVLILLYTVKVNKASLNSNIEILLNAAGNRNKSIYNERIESEHKMIQPNY